MLLFLKKELISTICKPEANVEQQQEQQKWL